jgi:UPF0716 protein FxsA
MRWLLVVAAFVVVPLAELWAILAVGDAIGVVPTILILLADSVLGALLLRAQGRGAWRRFVDALRTGRVPSRELADGLLILVGGALLLTPGFLTDVIGLMLLIPVTRVLARRALERGIARRLTAGMAATARGSDGPRSDDARVRFDVEGTATEYGGGPPPSGRARLER